MTVFFVDNQVFTKYTCGQVVEISDRNPFYRVEENAPVLMVMDLISKYKLNRIPVFDSVGDLITVVTQSAIVKLLCDNISYFSFASKRLGDLNIGVKPVFTVFAYQTAMDAFKLMNQEKVSAVAVVNPRSKLIGAISVSDLGRIGHTGELVSRLSYQAKDFIDLAKKILSSKHS